MNRASLPLAAGNEPHARSREFSVSPFLLTMAAEIPPLPPDVPPDLLFLFTNPDPVSFLRSSDLVPSSGSPSLERESSKSPASEQAPQAPQMADLAPPATSSAVPIQEKPSSLEKESLNSPAPEQDPPAPQVTDLAPVATSSAVPNQEKPASWTSNFKPHLRNLTKIGSPTISSDGIPQIQAPDSIVLKSAQTWKNHIVAYFHGNPPSPAKIFSDLNPIWGLKGSISIKKHSPGVFLILIPNVETRNWVLDVGFWHSGNCSITVTPWEANRNFQKMKLLHAPVWVLFRRVPRELWSEVGFSTIASAVGIPVHTEFPNIKPYSNGVVKLRVVVELAKKRANSVRITDKLGNSVLVLAEILKLPPRCGICREFGHLALRCPTPVTPRAPAQSKVQQDRKRTCVEADGNFSPDILVFKEVTAEAKEPFMDKSKGSSAKIPVEVDLCSSPIAKTVVEVGSSSNSCASSKSCAASPAFQETPSASKVFPDCEVSGDWNKVTRRSQPPPRSKTVSELALLASPVTSVRFSEEEDIINTAQTVLRNRFKALQSESALVLCPPKSKKQERRDHRQKLLQLTSPVATAISYARIVKGFSKAVQSGSGGLEHSPLGDVPVLES